MRPEGWALGAYRLLLRLYPRSFRENYERELSLTFRDDLRLENSLLGGCWCAAVALAGVLTNAPKEHLLLMITDIRYAFRTFLRSPWFTFAALATLAVGIGINSALFSVVKSVLIESLPYKNPGQLVRVWVTNPKQGFDRDVTSYPRFEDWKQRGKTFRDFAGFTGATRILTGVPEPRELRGAAVTPNFLRVMGVTPILGRDFEDGDDRQERPRVILLSQGLWRREFGADASIVGRALRLNGASCTVIGVLPDTLQFPQRGLDFWAPLILDPQLKQARGLFWLNVAGRLRDGVTIGQAQAEMDSIAKALQAQYVKDRSLGVALVGLQRDLTGPVRPALLVLSGAVIFVLLICCANIAGVLTARAAERDRELSIRAALGAGRGRVVRQLLTEAITLFLCGGILGVAVARLAVWGLLRLAPPELPQLQDTHLDFAVVGFTLIVSGASGLIFGLLPALQASRLRVVESLKQGGRSLAGRAGGGPYRSALMMGEMALAMALLSGAGLLIRSLERTQQAPLGFDARGVALAQLQLPGTKYPQGRQVADFYERLLTRVRNSAGIESAAAIGSLLLGQLPDSSIVTIEGRPETILTPLTDDPITPEFFSTMKIPLLRGRFFTAQDRRDSLPVVIVNATAAKRYWPDEDPVGKRLTYGTPGANTRWLTVAGVVADSLRAGPDRPVFTESYVPMQQGPDRQMQLVIRNARGIEPAKAALQAALHELDPEQPIASFMTLDTALGERIASRRFTTLLLTLFAGAALAIAAIGLYGLISYLVAQRLREFGVRMALGARPSDVLRLVVGRVVAMVGVGLVVGLAGALALSRGLGGFLFGISRFDPAPYALAACGLLLVSVAAAVSPAVRAIRADPLSALRAD